MNIFKLISNTFRAKPAPKSPVVRDAFRRMGIVKDDSPTGLAIRSTEHLMEASTKCIGLEKLNENDATRAAGIYFMTGVAIGYCYKYGAESEIEDIRAVVRCSLRSWVNDPDNADVLADNLEACLDDDDFSGAIIDSAISAVHASTTSIDAIVADLVRNLQKWRTFDIDCHLSKL
jgi:hypothetical protein